MTRVLSVASGKGGVGKTWFSISFGQALAQMSRRVLLVDCDVGLANIDIQLGLNPVATIHDVVVGEVTMSRAVQSVDALGIDVMPGRSGGAYPGGLDPLMTGWISSELRRLAGDYDVVILDLPSGVEEGVRELMRRADDDIVITTGEPTALTDAYALIKANRRSGARGAPSIMINFAEDVAAGRQTQEGLAKVCERFLKITPHHLGVIRRDRRVPEAIGRQMSLLQCYPGCDAARDVVAAATRFLASKDRG